MAAELVAEAMGLGRVLGRGAMDEALVLIAELLHLYGRTAQQYGMSREDVCELAVDNLREELANVAMDEAAVLQALRCFVLKRAVYHIGLQAFEADQALQDAEKSPEHAQKAMEAERTIPSIQDQCVSLMQRMNSTALDDATRQELQRELNHTKNSCLFVFGLDTLGFGGPPPQSPF